MKTEKPTLDLLVFELTQACNQSCRFCYNFWRDGKSAILPPDFSMARKTLKKVLSQVNISSISFSGGEPMLLPRVHDLILYARKHGTNVNFLTNGTLLTPDDMEIFADLGVGGLQIPILSADPQTHDFLTQVPGSWEKAIASLMFASSIKNGPRVSSVLILTAKNKDCIRETFDLYRSLGIKSVLVNRFNIGGQGIKFRRELELDHEELRQAFRIIDECAYGLDLVSGVCTPVCVIDPLQYRNIRFSFCTTKLQSRPVAMNHLGDVRFCNHSPFVLGNIFEKNIMDILSDETAAARYSALPEKCSECRFLQRCGGGCRAAAEQVFGSFNLPDPILNSKFY